MKNMLLQSDQKLKYLLFVLFVAIGQMSFAQSKTVTGTVIDDDGITLPGVNVIELGTTNASVTDIDGKYSITVPMGATLQYTYVGYAPQEILVGESNLMDVTLSQSSELIDEIVVTGYTSQRKRDITGAVSVIGSDDINVVPAASLSQKLAGKASGVTISTSGSPGDGTAIRIRGYNSLSNNDPLIVIDGVQTKDTYLNSINPNDIESIQVLKDAASASIYGARSSNGVIVVTTKKGKAGKTKISYNGYYGVQNPVNKFDLVNPTEYRDFTQRAAAATAGVSVPPIYAGSSFPDYYNGDPSQPYSYPDNLLMRPNVEGTDWWDEVISSAATTEHNINVSGGNEFSTFNMSGNYYNQQGTINHTYFKRFTARANSTFKKGRFSAGENISISHINQVGQRSGNQSEQNIITNILRTQRIVPVFDEGGNFAGPRAPGMGLGNNPVKGMDDDKDDVGTFNRILGNVYGGAELMEGLSVKTSLGFDFSTGFSQNASFPNYEAREPNQFTFNYSENWNTGLTWISTTTLNFNKDIGEQHSFSGLLGYEASASENRGIGGGLVDYFVFGLDSRYLNTGLADPATRSVGSGGSKTSFASMFAKVDYSFDDWLLLSGTVRRDGSSVFGPNNKYGVFPAASVGVRLTKFIQKDFIEDLKVRVSYGLSGNDAIRSDNAFARFGGGTSSSFYDIGGSNNSISTGYALQARGNPDGKWEELEQFNFGVDASLWAGKLTFVLDIFSKETIDLLFTAAEPGTGGSAAPAAKNVASMTNKGIDLQIGYRESLTEKLKLDLGLTVGTYRNEITKVSDAQTQFFSNNGTRIGTISLNRVGSPIGSFYGLETDGIFGSSAEVESHADQSGAAVGRIRFKDQNGDGVINDDDRTVLGSFHPDATLGFNIGLTYGKFDFSTFLFGSIGNEIYNFNKLFTDFYQFEANIRREVYENAWSTQNTDTNIPAPDLAGRVFNAVSSDYYVEDASYLRVESIQLGYTFDNIPNFDGNARFYLQGTNLFTLTGYSGLDPAMSNFGRADNSTGVDFGNYPSNKTVTVGFNLNF